MPEPQPSNVPLTMCTELLHTAGLAAPPHAIALLGVSTAEVWAITTAQGNYVLRVQPDAPPTAARKEQYLSDLLARHAVPAPRVVATSTTAQGSATLSTRLSGMRLDQVLPTLPPQEQDALWHAVGTMLRQIHTIAMPTAGEIVGDTLVPFPMPWAAWLLDGLDEDLAWLQQRLGFPMPDTHLLEELLQLGQRWLTDRPIRLIHNDALPQNILVAMGAAGWQCTGWIDWEFSRAGDALWDIATLDFRPAGLVPDAFYAGYGERPPAALHGLYDLLMATWRTRAVLEHGASWEWPPPTAWMRYLSSLPAHVRALVDCQA